MTNRSSKSAKGKPQRSELEIAFDAVEVDLYRRRDLLDRVIAVIRQMRTEKKKERGPVCTVDISRCHTLVQALAEDTVKQIKDRM